MSDTTPDHGARTCARRSAITQPEQRKSRKVLSARARKELGRHQRDCASHVQQVRSIDRVLTGSLAACDTATQTEMLAEMLERVQELRVGLQRIEKCLRESLPRGFSPA